jgi:hypothetical protein
MKNFLAFSMLLMVCCGKLLAQPCTVSGDQTTYGTNNVWIGYVYDNSNFTTYKSYVNEGTLSSPDFDQNFGGSNVTYNTTGCSINTQTFSVRYKLIKNFAAGSYTFTVGGDDGYRFSIDGGSTWIIDQWSDHAYNANSVTIALSGSTSMVLEYYENGGENRVSFAVAPVCTGSENTAIYGTNNVWNGYIYDGTNFNLYKGKVTEGAAANPNFDESFGGDNVSYTTSTCPVQTETFSARYRLTKTFANGTYQFTVGGDDGYRLSTDGGATYIINNWSDHGYGTTSNTVALNGTYNLVLDFYENGGQNRISFALTTISLLATRLQWITAKDMGSSVQLNWMITQSSTPRLFEVERSKDGVHFSKTGEVQANPSGDNLMYSYTDTNPLENNTYYRLKMSDKDKSVDYSKLVLVRRGKNTDEPILVYPTVITNNSFVVKTARSIRQASVVVQDFSGRIICKKMIGNLSAGQVVTIEDDHLLHSKGLLLVAVQGSDMQTVAKKIIVQ